MLIFEFLSSLFSSVKLKSPPNIIFWSFKANFSIHFCTLIKKDFLSLTLFGAYMLIKVKVSSSIFKFTSKILLSSDLWQFIMSGLVLKRIAVPLLCEVPKFKT